MLLSAEVDIFLNINVKTMCDCYFKDSEMNVTSIFNIQSV